MSAPCLSCVAPVCAAAHRIANQKALTGTDIEVPAILLNWDADLGGHTLQAASGALVLHTIGARVRPRTSSIANLRDHPSVLGLHARPLLRSALPQLRAEEETMWTLFIVSAAALSALAGPQRFQTVTSGLPEPGRGSECRRTRQARAAMGALLPTIAGQPPSAVPNPNRDKLEDCSWERALRDRRDRAGCRSGPHRKRDNRSCRQDFEEGHWSSPRSSPAD